MIFALVINVRPVGRQTSAANAVVIGARGDGAAHPFVAHVRATQAVLTALAIAEEVRGCGDCEADIQVELLQQLRVEVVLLRLHHG